MRSAPCRFTMILEITTHCITLAAHHYHHHHQKHTLTNQHLQWSMFSSWSHHCSMSYELVLISPETWGEPHRSGHHHSCRSFHLHSTSRSTVEYNITTLYYFINMHACNLSFNTVGNFQSATVFIVILYLICTTIDPQSCRGGRQTEQKKSM